MTYDRWKTRSDMDEPNHMMDDYTVKHDAFNGYCPLLSCFFGAIIDPGNDDYIAVQVFRDGNPIELGRFSTEEEAEMYAGEERARQLENLRGFK